MGGTFSSFRGLYLSYYASSYQGYAMIIVARICRELVVVVVPVSPAPQRSNPPQGRAGCPSFDPSLRLAAMAPLRCVDAPPEFALHGSAPASGTGHMRIASRCYMCSVLILIACVHLS